MAVADVTITVSLDTEKAEQFIKELYPAGKTPDEITDEILKNIGDYVKFAPGGERK